MASATKGLRDGSQTSRQRDSNRPSAHGAGSSNGGSLSLELSPPFSSRRHTPGTSSSSHSAPPSSRLFSLPMSSAASAALPHSRAPHPLHASPPPPPPPPRPSPAFASALPRIPPQPPAAAHTRVPTDYHTRRIRRRVAELEQRIALLMLEKEKFAMQEKYAQNKHRLML